MHSIVPTMNPSMQELETTAARRKPPSKSRRPGRSAPSQLSNKMFGDDPGVRDGPPEIYADTPMVPLEVLQELRSRCRAAFGLPSVSRGDYVTGGEAYAILRCCYYHYNATYDHEAEDVRIYRRRRCLQDLLLYNAGESLPDYVKSAALRDVTFDNVAELLRQFYRDVVVHGMQGIRSYEPVFHGSVVGPFKVLG